MQYVCVHTTSYVGVYSCLAYEANIADLLVNCPVVSTIMQYAINHGFCHQDYWLHSVSTLVYQYSNHMYLDLRTDGEMVSKC